MSTEPGEDERSRSGHEAIIDDSWLRAREYIRRAEAADVDPTRVLWPPAAGRITRKHELALAAHSATIQFRDDICSYRLEDGVLDVASKWTEPVDVVKIDDEEMAVSLKSLKDWSHQRQIKRSESMDPVRGRTVSEEELRVLLPVRTCRAAYRHIQDILRELGFTAETRDVTPEDDASPEDLVGLLTARGQEEAKANLPARFLNDGDEA